MIRTGHAFAANEHLRELRTGDRRAGDRISQVRQQGATAYQGAVSVSPGVWLYQITGDRLALELTAKGTKYDKDSDLN
jgi:hypothetical protein